MGIIIERKIVWVHERSWNKLVVIKEFYVVKKDLSQYVKDVKQSPKLINGQAKLEDLKTPFSREKIDAKSRLVRIEREE